MKKIFIMLCALTGLAGAQQTSTPKPPPGVPLDAKNFNGHWYKVIFDRVDWPQAKQECERMGGQLAIIRDAPTWNFVMNLTQRRMWLGASNENIKNEWRWLDGSLVTFTAWIDGHPNNAGGREHYLSETDSNSWDDRAKEWDQFTQWPIEGFICQWRDPSQLIAYSVPVLPPGIPADAKIFNGQGYKVFFERVNWDKAKQRCEQMGGQLAVVPDPPTWEYIKQLTQKRVWLGATDEAKEGAWKWVDGSPMIFNVWQDGEPNNGKQENYLMRWDGQGEWNDIRKEWDTCSPPIEGFICQWKGNATKMAAAPANAAIIEVATWAANSGVLTMKSQNRLRSFRVTPATAISLNGLKSKPDIIAPALRVMSFTLLAGNAEELGSLTLEGIAKPGVPAPAVPQAGKPQDPLPNTGIEIISATYGSGRRHADVTDRVIDFMETNPRRLVVRPQDLGADPTPGWNKELVITHKWRGHRRTMNWGENSHVEPVSLSLPNSKDELTEWLPGTKWQAETVMIFHRNLFLAEGTEPIAGQSYPQWRALDGRKVIISLERGSDIEFGLSWDCSTMVEKGPTQKTLKRILSPSPPK
jgi:hypothetical protein